MANKKNDAPEVDPRAPIQTEWAGHVRWQCPFCPRDGGDKDLIEAHIADAHPIPSPSVTELLAAQTAPEPSEAETQEKQPEAPTTGDKPSGDETPAKKEGE